MKTSMPFAYRKRPFVRYAAPSLQCNRERISLPDRYPPQRGSIRHATSPEHDTAPDLALAHRLQGVHEWLGNAMMILIGIHVAGALWHRFVLRDNALARMA